MVTYFEDISVGQTRSFGQYTITRDEIVSFAEQFDPQPFHTDEEAARDSFFGGLVASGMHTLCICMRLAVTGFYLDAANVAGKGIDNLRWRMPVYPDDTLSVTSEVLKAQPSESRDDCGEVTSRWTMRNQEGEPVLDLEVTALFLRREST